MATATLGEAAESVEVAAAARLVLATTQGERALATEVGRALGLALAVAVAVVTVMAPTP